MASFRLPTTWKVSRPVNPSAFSVVLKRMMSTRLKLQSVSQSGQSCLAPRRKIFCSHETLEPRSSLLDMRSVFDFVQRIEDGD